jgi:hypothetical protein
MDSLTAGFGVVNEQPWIVLFPVSLDLFFLFGPRVSIAPVISQFVTRQGFTQAFGAEATAQSIALSEEINVLGLLSPGGMSLPTIVPLMGVARGSFTLLDSPGIAALLAVAAVLIGALVGCVYRALMAQQARDGGLSARALPAEAFLSWYRVLALVVLVVVAAMFVLIPLAFVAAIASLVAGGIATAFMTAIVATIALAAQLYLFFAPDAIFLSRVGPIEAIRRSVSVVHTGIWSALTLAVLFTVIMVGMGQIWVMLASQPSWGLALGIVGNAYIASGLVAASMLFYRERMEILLAERS